MEALEAFYADDATHGFLHCDAVFVARAVGFTAGVFDDVARRHGLLLNLGPGKTEAVVSLRGSGAVGLRRQLAVDGGIATERFILRVVCA